MPAVMSRMSTELSTSVPTSPGVSLSGGSYCAAIGRRRGSRPRADHHQNMARKVPMGIKGPIAPEKACALGKRTGFPDYALVESYGKGEAFVHRQSTVGGRVDTGAGDFDSCILTGRAEAAGESLCPQSSSAFWEQDVCRSGFDGDGPLIASDVPIKLIVIVEKFQGV